jgi:hypothetical protein
MSVPLEVARYHIRNHDAFLFLSFNVSSYRHDR